MTAARDPAPRPAGGAGRTWAEATPAEVRAGLSPESAEEFDAHWRTVLARAAETYDLTPVQACLEAWRRVARVTDAAGGADGYRALREQAAHALEREEAPHRSVSWREVRVELGL